MCAQISRKSPIHSGKSQRRPCQCQASSRTRNRDSARPVSTGPCQTTSHCCGILVSCQSGHNARCARVGSQDRCATTASSVRIRDSGRRIPTSGTTSRFASGPSSARLPKASTVIGEVSANGARQVRQSCSKFRRIRGKCSGSGTRPAHSSPSTPAIDSAKPASSAVAGSSRRSRNAEKAMDSSASTLRPEARASSSTVAIHAARSVASAEPVSSV